MNKLSIKCPAKINLFLNIQSKRKDGYHNLLLINDSINLYDILTIIKTKNDGIRITCSNKNIPTDINNSVYKMSEFFFTYNKILDKNIKIIIKKNIPVFSGLGGESTDAAGILILLNKLYNTNMSKEKMLELCAKVGSDVSYCLIKGRCKVEGTGNKIKTLVRKEKYFYVIVYSGLEFSTKEMFSKVKEYKKVKIKYGFNDFEKYVNDEIDPIKKELELYNPLFSMMTGSGSCIYSAFSNKKSAKKCYKDIKKRYKTVYFAEEVN